MFAGIKLSRLKKEAASCPRSIIPPPCSLEHLALTRCARSSMMSEMLRSFALFFVLLVGANAQTRLAATPPMGWNSCDSFGLTVTEPEFKANAQWMAANLKQYGWKYA